ncbi:hypothetical protein ACFV4P_31600 [Kitasatospora sp. NPDC059795]|uniref:hypothetical protein n=1 Tax=Kitasatospora sp. NPDC059795 TaxID=3346949 RepID=UPI00364EF31B
MTVPAPPDRPESEPTVEAAPAAALAVETAAAAQPVKNPWAAPDPNAVPPVAQAPVAAGGYWQQPFTAPAPQARNGMGVTALVLGIVAVVLSLPLILFWFTWLPALLAVIFGIIGMNLARKGLATNRGLALTGVVLGGVGLLASVGTGVLAVVELRDTIREHDRTVQEQQHSTAERQRLADEQRQRSAAEQEAKAADERARRLSFGGTYTYPDGLKVTMARPTATTPSRSGGAQLPEDATFVQVQVTVVNTTSAELSLYGSGLLIVKDANGTLLHPLFGGGQYKGLPQSLAPGQEATALETYGLPNASADPFSLQFTHGTRLERKDVIWTGAPPH